MPSKSYQHLWLITKQVQCIYITFNLTKNISKVRTKWYRYHNFVYWFSFLKAGHEEWAPSNTSEHYITENVNSKEEKVPPSLDDESCFGPLGMEHGHIDDEDITASSAFDFKSVGPQNAR